MGNAKKRLTLTDAATAVAAAGIQPSPMVPRIGRIVRPKFVSPDEMKEVRGQIDDWAGGAREACQAIGKILDYPEGLEFQLEAVLDAERNLIEEVLGTSEGRPRDIVATALMNAMIEHFPNTMLGLRHLADVGVHMQFLGPWEPGKGFFVELPVGDDLKKTRFVSLVSGVGETMARLNTKAIGVVSAWKAARKELEDTLHDLSNGFLGVWAAGVGETACTVFFFETTRELEFMGLRLADGLVTVTAAIGENTEKLVGVSLPLADMEPEMISPKTIKGMTRRQVDAVLNLRRYLRQAIKQAELRQQRALQMQLAPVKPIATPVPEK